MFDLDDILLENREMIEEIVGEGINLTFKTHNELPELRFEESKIEEILVHLVLNSKEAMKGEGNLYIETNIVRGEAVEGDSSERKGKEYVNLRVKDEGEGMDEETFSKMFNPFFSTRENRSGLGLSMVYEIIDNLNGFVEVESEPGNGTDFNIYFPVRKELEDIDTKRETDDLKNKCILVVEDERIVRRFNVRILEDRGFSVLSADCCKKALEIFYENSEDIDLIFSDIVLPDGDGVELVEKLQKDKKDIEIILTSGYTDREALLDSIKEKKYKFLKKPYEVEKLLKEIGDSFGIKWDD